MLKDAGVEFVEKTADGGKRFDDVSPGDVVILPAFGATLAEMQHFDEMGVTTVDTTCPWVTKVWNVVDKQVAKGLTTIIHGKYAHEEARSGVMPRRAPSFDGGAPTRVEGRPSLGARRGAAFG